MSYDLKSPINSYLTLSKDFYIITVLIIEKLKNKCVYQILTLYE